MDVGSQAEREVRAARNQAMFRGINEKLMTLNEAFSSVMETFTIACECADQTCVAMIDLVPEQYAGVRAKPRCFVVLPDHVYPDVEVVVDDFETYVVVEKTATAGEMATLLDPRSVAGDQEG